MFKKCFIIKNVFCNIVYKILIHIKNAIRRKLKMNINYWIHQIFNVEEAGNIYNNIKDNDLLKDNNLSCFTFIGKESDVQKYLNSINCEFLVAVLKCPLEMRLDQCSKLLEKISAKCLPDTELFTLTDMYLHEITIFGIVKLLDSSSGFSENIPSSSEPTLKERV